jgi:Peptidase family C25/Propeptide_C25
MKRLIPIFAACLVLVAFSPAWAAWYGLAADQTAPAMVEVVGADANGLTMQIVVPGLEVTEPEDGYAALEIPSEGYAGAIGDPRVPTITRMIRVPLGANVTVHVDGAFFDLPLSALNGAPRVMPVQPPVPKVPGAREAAVFQVNESAYQRTQQIFATQAEIVDDVMLRGYRLVTLRIHPVNYNPAQQALQVAETLTVNVTFEGADWAETEYIQRRYADPRTAAIAEAAVLNFNNFPSGKATHYTASSYVFVAPAAVFDHPKVQALMEWKAQRGFDVIALATEETGNTPQAIRAYLMDAYANWDRPPAYVLLLGDTNIVPQFIGSTGRNLATDLYYATMDNADYFADLGVGRLPFRTDVHLSNMIDKILKNEKNLWEGTDDWTQHATFMASRDNWNISEGTHNAVCATFLAPNGFDCTKVYYQHGGTTQQALAAINTGPTIHTYSGHGSDYSWADGPPVSQAQVNGLTNKTNPLVLSHSCLTGRYELAECFGETWVRTKNGALAFWGASDSTYWDEDDIVEKAMYWGWFTGGDSGLTKMPWTSAMLDFSLVKLHAQLSGQGLTYHYFEMYNLMGDPEVLLYSAPPAEIAPTHPSYLAPGETMIEVSLPGIEGAMVGVYADGENCGCAFTNAAGDAVVEMYRGSKADEVTLTVTGENLAPYSAVIPISSEPPADDDDDDATPGDDDDDTIGDDDDDDTIGDDDDDTTGADDDDDDDDDSGGGCG